MASNLEAMASNLGVKCVFPSNLSSGRVFDPYRIWQGRAQLCFHAFPAKERARGHE